jgi:hypothetical protein
MSFKYIVLPFLLISSMALGQTVILYEDGSTLTLRDGEEVYVSEYGVYKARGGLVKTLRIERMKPNEKRDYVEPAVSEPVPCDGQLTFGGGCIEEVEEVEVTCENNPFTFGGGVAAPCEEVIEETEEEASDGGDFTFGG